MSEFLLNIEKSTLLNRRRGNVTEAGGRNLPITATSPTPSTGLNTLSEQTSIENLAPAHSPLTGHPDNVVGMEHRDSDNDVAMAEPVDLDIDQILDFDSFFDFERFEAELAVHHPEIREPLLDPSNMEIMTNAGDGSASGAAIGLEDGGNGMSMDSNMEMTTHQEDVPASGAAMSMDEFHDLVNGNLAQAFRLFGTMYLEFVIPEYILNGVPDQLWSYIDAEGHLGPGPHGWVPHFMEEDWDFDRFSGVRLPNPQAGILPLQVEDAQTGDIEMADNQGVDSPNLALAGAAPSNPAATTSPANSAATTTPAKSATPNTATAKPPRNRRVNKTPTAAELLARRSGGFKRKYAVPKGLQRIKTHDKVDELAQKKGVPVPPVLDADVVEFFKHQQKVPSHAFTSFATPPSVDIRVLGNMRITATELITFFPNHYKWHDAIYRLTQNGWTPTDIARYSNYARHLPGDESTPASRIHDYAYTAYVQIKKPDPGKFGTVPRPSFKTTCFTASNWVVPKLDGLDEQLIDYFLVDLAAGVTVWPTGFGARILTRAIDFAIRYGFSQVKLSQIHDFVRVHQLGQPLLPPMARMGLVFGRNPDAVLKTIAMQDVERYEQNLREGAQEDTVVNTIEG